MISNKAKKYLQSIPAWNIDSTNEIPDSFLCFVLYSSFYDDFCSMAWRLYNEEKYKEELETYLDLYVNSSSAEDLCFTKLKDDLLKNSYPFLKGTLEFALDIFFIYKMDISNYFPVVNGALYDAFIDFFAEEETENE